jgi:D-lactate dehydrogenase (cytochrome)
MAVTEIPAISRASPATIDAARRQLSELLGADRVRTGADDLAQHGRDESFHPEARPDMVVWPADIDEAAAIVRVAAGHRLPLVPFGAGTSLEGHVAALAGGLCVDMRDMDAIGRPSIEDLDVVVQAGVTRRALDAGCTPRACSSPSTPGPTPPSAG